MSKENCEDCRMLEDELKYKLERIDELEDVLCDIENLVRKIQSYPHF